MGSDEDWNPDDDNDEELDEEDVRCGRLMSDGGANGKMYGMLERAVTEKVDTPTGIGSHSIDPSGGGEAEDVQHSGDEPMAPTFRTTLMGATSSESLLRLPWNKS